MKSDLCVLSKSEITSSRDRKEVLQALPESLWGKSQEIGMKPNLSSNRINNRVQECTNKCS